MPRVSRFTTRQLIKSRIYVVDFPKARGFVKEEILVTPGTAFMRAWEGSKPVTLGRECWANGTGGSRDLVPGRSGRYSH
jgi:hypothetical protein